MPAVVELAFAVLGDGAFCPGQRLDSNVQKVLGTKSRMATGIPDSDGYGRATAYAEVMVWLIVRVVLTKS
jgi:hypothetical protein